MTSELFVTSVTIFGAFQIVERSIVKYNPSFKYTLVCTVDAQIHICIKTQKLFSITIRKC